MEGRKEARGEAGRGCNINDILGSDPYGFRLEMLELIFMFTGLIYEEGKKMVVQGEMESFWEKVLEKRGVKSRA